MMLTTIRHWENGKVTCMHHGSIVWVNRHLGEFVFEGSGVKFWGKTDYWDVVRHQIPIVGRITVVDK